MLLLLEGSTEVIDAASTLKVQLENARAVCDTVPIGEYQDGWNGEIGEEF